MARTADAGAIARRITRARDSGGFGYGSRARFASCAVTVALVSLASVACESSTRSNTTDCAELTKRAIGASRGVRVLRPGAGADAIAPGFWFGPRFRGRRAVVAVERLPRRFVDPAYITYYERRGAGCATSATSRGDNGAPTGEIAVLTRSVATAEARNVLRIVNGGSGNTSRSPWPRFSTTLHDRQSATAIPARGDRPGLAGTRGFLVLTRNALVTVTGEILSDAQIRHSARMLRHVSQRRGA